LFTNSQPQGMTRPINSINFAQETSLAREPPNGEISRTSAPRAGRQASACSVLIDENLSPVLAKALNALFAGEHEVEHVRIKFGPDVTDADWIRRLSEDGHWIVISGDAKIAKRKAEQAAFRNSRLIGFFLAPALNGAKVTKQMQRLLALWDDIEVIANRVASGSMYELPIKGKIRQFRM